jgi:hypothetical protein
MEKELEYQNITILGEQYKIIMTTGNDNPRLSHADGYCGNYDNVIFIEKDIFTQLPDAEGEESVEILQIRRLAHVKRHEIIHAFFKECGLTDWRDDERLVDWIANMFPKMLKVFKEVNAA